MTRTARVLETSSLLVALTMVASFTPTPLFPLYRHHWGLDSRDISLVFAAYPVGTIVVLILFGGLSDRWGRMPTLRLGGAVMVLSMGVMALATSLGLLVLGRFVQGVGAGLVATAAAAALMELHPRGAGSGSHRNALAVSIGIAVGPVLAAVAAHELPVPLAAPYVVVGVLIMLPLLALLLPATGVFPENGVTAGILRPIRVPRRLVWTFGLAATAIVGANATFAMLGSFGPDVVADAGQPDALTAGFFVTGVFALVTVMQVVARRAPVLPALVAGAAAMALGWAAMAAGAGLESLMPVVAGGVAVGVGAGTSMLAAMSHVAAISPPDRRAEMYAAFLLVAFTTMTVASLTFGRIVGEWSVTHAALVVAGLNALVAVHLVIAGRSLR